MIAHFVSPVQAHKQTLPDMCTEGSNVQIINLAAVPTPLIPAAKVLHDLQQLII